MSNGPFLYSDITVESPELARKPSSLQLSCHSSDLSLKSRCSTNDAETVSVYSEEDFSGFRRGSDSGTVILCSNANSPTSSFTTEEGSQTMKSTGQTTCSDHDVNWSIDTTSKGSRLDQVLERIFVQVSPEGDIKVNHLACLTHIKNVINENIKEARILVFNCQEPDSDINDMFDEVVDCCFDLSLRPNLEWFIQFCETCYDWLAQNNSNIVLFHSESVIATKRLFLLLFAYASFCDSIERQNVRTNRRLKAYLSAYPNGNTSVPVVFLRYAAYMKIFSPFRRQNICKATMSIHSIVLHNTPLFTDNSVDVFLKIYSYSPLRHVYTTHIHNISGRLCQSAVLLFTKEPITVRGDVIILCYRLKRGGIERRRVFKLIFHSCEGHEKVLTFNYDAFDEISEAVPLTFKMDLNLVPLDDGVLDNFSGSNVYIENTAEVRQQDKQNPPSGHCIDAMNIIQSRTVSLQAIRLSDSLEDIEHVPNRSSILATSQELEEVTRELIRNRSQTFNEYFMNLFGRNADRNRWSSLTSSKQSTKSPKRPPPPDLQRLRAPKKTSEMNLASNLETSDRSSIDSGTSVHSESSDVSERSLNKFTKHRFGKLRKTIKGVVSNRKHKKAINNKSDPLTDEEMMPPPSKKVVPRSKTAAKSVAFLNATPLKVPPPRPPPPKLVNAIKIDREREERQGKTPAGVRSVPTKYFGPREKYQKLGEKDFGGVQSYRLQLLHTASERSTPTIVEDQEAEDFEEAEYRQLQKEGYNFYRNLPSSLSGTMSTTATTQDLDQLLEELRRTSLDYTSSTARSPASHINGTHSSRVYSSQQSSTFAEPAFGSAGKYSTRSYSFTGSGGSRSGGRWASNSSSPTFTSYQRSQAYSTERGMGINRGGSSSAAPVPGEGSSGFVRHSTPAPQSSSSQQQRFQTTFRTTLNHRPPISPKRFNQINVTIDPEFGTSSLLSDNRDYLTTSLPRAQMNTNTSAIPMDESSDTMSYRELQLLQELSSARQELAMLKRASSVVDEPLHKLPPPSTLPTQRRAFQHQKQQELNSMEMFSRRHHMQYQSHHDIQQGSSLYRPHGRYDTLNSGFAYGTPKRAMSSANVTSSQSWNYRNGMTSGPQSPALGYSSIRSTTGSLRSGGGFLGSQGYSARRERLKQEAERAEALRQSSQRINNVAASSSDLRSTSLHQQHRQRYHSMSTIQPERTEFEEIETVTLQPIGRGVQDLGSNMGSTATLNRPSGRPVASSMLEGLNRVDIHTANRQPRANMSSFGRQTSAMDISQSMSARPQRAASNSFLTSIRRESAGTASDTATFQRQMASNKSSGFAAQQNHQQQFRHQQQFPIIQQNPSHSSAVQQSQSQLQPALIQGSSQVQQQQQKQQISQQMQLIQQNQQQYSKQEMEWDAHQKTSTTNVAAPVPMNGQLVDLSLVEATSPIWYRLKISRQEAISILKNQPTGSFLVRDSTTFKDAYGLAVKSGKPPNKPGQKSGFAKFMKNILNDINNDQVRHYLIETVTAPTRGVRIKGFSAEQVFPNLLALIQYHTQYPVALPCCLVLPPIPPSQTAAVVTTGNSTLQNGNGNGNGDSDSVTLVQNNGIRSLNQTPTSANENSTMMPVVVTTGDTLDAPTPSRSITSPLSPTVGMFRSELISPPPSISCRCLYLGAVEVDCHQPDQANLMAAVDVLIPGSVLQATTCDQLGEESPVQYTECQLQAAHNEGILLTDLSRKLFFQRHFSAGSFIFAGVDHRNKAFIHPNHSALGIDKPKLFGFISKKVTGENTVHIFSEFDPNCGASIITAQINSLLLNK